MENKKEEHLDFITKLRKTKFWRTLEVLSPILAIGIPLFLYYLNKDDIELSVNGIQSAELIETPNDLSSKLSVEIDGKKVCNILQYQFEIKNTGNKDIDGKDIHFLKWLPSENLEIISYQVVKKSDEYGDFINLSIDSSNYLDISLLSLNKNAYAEILVNCASDSSFNFTTDIPQLKFAATQVKIINRLKEYTQDNKLGFIHYVFGGGIWIILSRIVIYGLIGIGILILIAISGYKISELRKANQTNKRIARMGSDPYIDVTKFKDNDDKRRASETYELISKLNQKELLVLDRMYNIVRKMDDNETKFAVEHLLSSADTEVYQNIKSKGNVDSILNYANIYYTKETIDYFKKKAANK
jgi:hypothetical protein